MGLNLGGNKKDLGSKKTEVHTGSYEQMQKTKAQKLPEILKEVEKLFEKYEGGGVAIVMNQYDENGDVEGNTIAIMGVDKPQGLIRLAKGLHVASEEVIDNLTTSGNPAALAGAVVEMLRDLLEDHNGKKS